MTQNAASNVQKDAMAEVSKAASDPALLVKGMQMANDVTAEVKAAAGEEAVDAAEAEVASNTMEQ